ncbi:unnamed protein product [Leptosia nina]|uniref:NADP-dependent oxidoreductase domain-containing protein n=1 Tax=Leptosia nina TaxID=320188 RepID=A0AAV1K1L1_9NEOP
MTEVRTESQSFIKNYIRLHNGMKLPSVGIGTYQVRNYDDIYTLVESSLANGYKLFDTAAVYRNEAYLGLALKELLPKYNLDREDIFVTTKLSPSCHGLHIVSKALEESLNNLAMEYVDMYMIHFPGTAGMPCDSPNNKNLRYDTWTAMNKLCDEGKTKCIGVCNFTKNHISQLLESHTSVPVVNQVELHPFYKQKELLEYCRERDICVQAYCSFGGASKGSLDLFANTVVKNIASIHKVTPAQVLLVWALQQGIAVIPKSTSPNRICENAHLSFQLTPEDMQALSSLNVYKKYAWDPAAVL